MFHILRPGLDTPSDHVFYRETPGFELFFTRQKTDVTIASLLYHWRKLHEALLVMAWQIELHRANINEMFLLFHDIKVKLIQIIRPGNSLLKDIKYGGYHLRWYLTLKCESSNAKLELLLLLFFVSMFFCTKLELHTRILDFVLHYTSLTREKILKFITNYHLITTMKG